MTQGQRESFLFPNINVLFLHFLMKNQHACFFTVRVISWGQSSELLMKMEIYSVNQQYVSLNSYKTYSAPLCGNIQIEKHQDSWTLIIMTGTRKVKKLRCIPECGSNENRSQKLIRQDRDPQSCGPEDVLARGKKQKPKDSSGSCFLMPLK